MYVLLQFSVLSLVSEVVFDQKEGAPEEALPNMLVKLFHPRGLLPCLNSGFARVTIIWPLMPLCSFT